MRFKLQDNFVEQYAEQEPSWGFGGLGEVVYYRTYSRQKEDGSKERWYETVRRVVEGAMSQYVGHLEKDVLNELGEGMYDYIFNFKMLPGGRGLWSMGTDIVNEKGLVEALSNCAFVSTYQPKDPARPFAFQMDVSMLGVGLGLDTKAAGRIKIHRPKNNNKTFVIPDSREGWVESVYTILNAFFTGESGIPEFDYSKIRSAGEPIKTFGGISAGPEPLKELHKKLIERFSDREGEHLTKKDVVDVATLIGKAVVSGNVRRSAILMLDNDGTQEFIDLKNYEKNPDRVDHGWVANHSFNMDTENSIDFDSVVKNINVNGEPGLLWMDKIREYGRLVDGLLENPDKAEGVNACLPESANFITKEGITPLSDVKVGETVWDGENFSEIVDKWSNGIKDVYEIETSYGKFRATEDHVVVTKDGNLELKDASTIRRVRGPEVSVKTVPLDVIDGLLHGDGTKNGGGGRQLKLIIGENDQDYLNSEVSHLLGGAYYKEKKAYNINNYTLNIKEFENRSIPDRFFYGKPFKVAGFLRGLFSANGSVSGDKFVSLKSTYKKEIERVQVMLRSLGIFSHIVEVGPKKVEWDNGIYISKKAYDLVISDRVSLEIFYNTIGFLQKYKMDALRDTLGKYKYIGSRNNSYDFSSKFGKITSFEKIGEEEVFDFTVDNEKHTAWVDGFEVHNCGEMALESYEHCLLSEIFLNRIENFDEFKEASMYAYLYGKAVTMYLADSRWKESSEVITRNRRMGISLGGVAQFLNKNDKNTLIDWSDMIYGYIRNLDSVISDRVGIAESIKLTTIKPSGTVSYLSGASPGVHYPNARYIEKRMRVSKELSSLVQSLKDSGVYFEEAVNEPNTLVFYFPMDYSDSLVSPSMEEQVEVAELLTKYFTDNQVSLTVTVPENTTKERLIDLILGADLKALTFFPEFTEDVPQKPMAVISEKKFKEYDNNKVLLNYKNGEDSNGTKYCSDDVCEIEEFRNITEGSKNGKVVEVDFEASPA